MNTNTIRTNIEWPGLKTSDTTGQRIQAWNAAVPLHQATHFSTRLLQALLPALAIIVGSAWAIGTFETSIVLQALIWAAGFVFLAIAVEARKLNFAGLLLTGLALPVLAVLSSKVAVEFAIVAAALIAGWVATAIFKR